MEAVLWIVGVLVVMLGFPVMCNMRGDQQGVPPPRAEPGEGGAHHRMVTCPYDKEDQPGHEYCL